MPLTDLFATRTEGMKASEIRELLKLLDQPEVISFAGGIPDPTLFPREAYQRAMIDCTGSSEAASALQYAPSEGYLPLRQWIARYMAQYGVICGADNILITAGSQQALDYLGKLFLDAGDTVLVGWPTYLGALGAFNAYQPRYDRLDVATNQPPAALQDAAGGRVKFAYLSPDFANPTGVSLDLAERGKILDLADALDIAVVEDGAYQALRYSGDRLPPLLAIEQARKGDIDACRTIYCGSFSKTLAPGLRVGWVVAARPVIGQMVLLKQAADLQTATLNQMVTARVAEELFEPHVEQLRAVYGARLKAMLAALDRHMPEGVRWTRPEGGMFVWCQLPEGIDGADLLAQALATEKVAFVPGGAFFADGSNRNTLRLNFSMPNEAQIEEGITRLGRTLRVAMAAR
ncbi:aminotransferase-like domain-containing protein [Paenirhodobacter populi]|uniref:PLP-dependent aminotransferase family protein n=1 Tax=Paenirhodobacter populi TaxID=2306993 RepID=A0A443JLQ0_9RHOB|nr:PLP-dependent aminotransferase family protein [Sinirhodobacter populi]RWR21096.1 PLP-dependent aminotransferase family protein [Sinirhodobacter populi]